MFAFVSPVLAISGDPGWIVRRSPTSVIAMFAGPGRCGPAIAELAAIVSDVLIRTPVGCATLSRAVGILGPPQPSAVLEQIGWRIEIEGEPVAHDLSYLLPRGTGRGDV